MSICLISSIISNIQYTPKGRTGFSPSSGLFGLVITLLSPAISSIFHSLLNSVADYSPIADYGKSATLLHDYRISRKETVADFR